MMKRTLLRVCAALACATLTACSPEAAPDAAADVKLPIEPQVAPRREHVREDIYHYWFDLPVGKTANARVRIHRVVRERSPYQPYPTRRAILLLHGDFATFVTNFAPSLGMPPSPAPGLAPYLVEHGVDVWGADRRWTLPGTADDTSDFGEMGLAQELGDISTALAAARATRAVTDGDPGRITLGGFSHGAQLAYAYAAADGRHLSALAPLDSYYDIAPADANLRAQACANEAFEQDAVESGITDSDNGFFVLLGTLARSAPSDPSPLLPPLSNREALLFTVGQTYQFAPFTPRYHLNAPRLDRAGTVSGLRESSEASVAAWFAGAPPHQSMREAAELDEIWCGSGARPELSRVQVPVFYLGAAGGFGDYGLYSTTRVASKDVRTHVVRRFDPARIAEDFGHGDLLYAEDAPRLAWEPLLRWLLR